MKIVTGSLFANATGYLKRYIGQLTSLNNVLTQRGHHLTCLFAEGDSTDGTREELRRCAETARLDFQIVPADHGGPIHRSVENQERFRLLATVGNKLLDAVVALESGPPDIYWHVESDLIWSTDTAIALMGTLQKGSVGGVAPCVWYVGIETGHFYDTFAFRKNQQRFSPFSPWHPSFRANVLMDMDSVGSCMAIRGELVPHLRFPPEDCIVGLCGQIRERGFRVVCDTSLHITHPRRAYDR